MFTEVVHMIIFYMHSSRKVQCRSKISELRIRVPYESDTCMRMLSYAYAYVLPLLFIAIPLLYVALSCTTNGKVKATAHSTKFA